MNKPLVSVCLLTYMQQNYIEDCLKGIISQTYPDMELLILDEAVNRSHGKMTHGAKLQLLRVMKKHSGINSTIF